MKEYDLPCRATCKACANFGGPCPHRGGATCPRFRRNDRLAGLLVSITAIVIVLVMAILIS